MRLLPRAADWADLWTPPRRTGVIALASVLAAGVFAAAAIAPLARALVESRGSSAGAGAAGVDRFAADVQLASDRVLGRSMFFVPAPPPPPPPPPPPGRGPPPPPSRYAGPSLIAMINDEVWFSDGRKLAVGDESDETLAVLEIKAPWSARVRWQGVEFDVPLFDRSAITRPPETAPPPVTPPPETPSPATDPAKPGETPPGRPDGAPPAPSPDNPGPSDPAPDDPPAGDPAPADPAPADPAPETPPAPAPGADPAPAPSPAPTPDPEPGAATDTSLQ